MSHRVRIGWVTPLSAALLAAIALHAQGDLNLNVKVVMDDGSPLPRPATVQRSCYGRNPVLLATTNKAGEAHFSEVLFQETDGDCFWNAVIPGYVSDEIGIGVLQASNNLPDMVLHSENSVVPAIEVEARNRALKLQNAKQWAQAEDQFRKILDAFPKCGPVWEDLGFAYLGEQRRQDARQAFQRGVDQAPRYVGNYDPLAQLEMGDGDWETAETTALAGIKLDTRGSQPGLQLDLAEVREHLKEDGAETAARKAIALDKTHKHPRAEYILGLIQAEDGDYASAVSHLKRYLDLSPKADDAQAVRARIKEFQSSAAQAATDAAAAARDRTVQGSSDVTVPGGLAAVARMAHLKQTPAPADFFLEYCRAIADAAGPGGSSDIPQYIESLEAYFTAAASLTQIPQNRDGQIALAPDFTTNSKSLDLLRLFGWRAVPGLGGARVELSELSVDGPRQLIPGALGIDEVTMSKTLASGSSFHFAFHSENAPVLEANSWRAIAGAMPAGGFAELFVRNPLFAAAYAGLAGMGPGAAAAVISSVGLRGFVNRFSSVARYYGGSFRVDGGRAVSPGGPGADAIWEHLAGASPRDPKAFFTALLSKDESKLAAFYAALSQADDAHQRLFTRDAATAEQFYKLFHDSDELRARVNPRVIAWRAKLFQEAPLDAAGNVRFPGGDAAWPGGFSAALPRLETLVPLAALERDRKAPLDADSARILSEHYASWRALFPYFVKLPALGAPEFRALAAFETRAASLPPADRNRVLGEWHSLVKLTILASQAGSLDPAAAAAFFRRSCEAASASDDAAQSVATLRAMAGGAEDLDDAVPTRLLRLNGDARDSFDRVKAIERTARFTTLRDAPSSHVLPVLMGQVYAALLDPAIQLVSEDPQLPSRHAFDGGAHSASLFAPTRMETYHEAGASRFSGGFMTFEQVASGLARAKAGDADLPETAAAIIPASAGGPDAPLPVTQATFRIRARMVEVYAAVTDEHGKYVDDLSAGDFTLLDNNKPTEIAAFENHAAGVSLALVLDTTGSMAAALPALKAAAIRLIDNLRPVDSVAVYSFNDKVSEVQPFTNNRELAKRAVLGARAYGDTGLNDALVHVSRELCTRGGKKAIVVFTDGADNTSGLNPDAAIRRAKSDGVTVYTVAHGDALHSADLQLQLQSTAEATGGLSFSVDQPEAIRGVFEHILEDLMHGYLLAFQPPADGGQDWRALHVVTGRPALKVRAREGYFPQ
ncbi:MAG TPA: VWA domain-containing protein [Bryobacteraceae bacterium]|nr:VWA domain-containing protein [Bryobacteraceae bacterium]